MTINQENLPFSITASGAAINNETKLKGKAKGKESLNSLRHKGEVG